MNQLTGVRSLVFGTWRHRLAAVLFFAALGLIGAPTASAAVIDTVYWNGYDYYLISENSAFLAEFEARSLGGHLATITSQEEHDFLWATWGQSLGTGLGLWIGLTDQVWPGVTPDQASEGTFAWFGGEPVSFTNWFTATLEPNNGRGQYREDYVVMDSRKGGKWNDVPHVGPGWRAARGIVKVKREAVEPAGQGATDASATDNGLDPQDFSTGNEVTVATLYLPAGNYVLAGKVLVGNRSTSAEQVTCSLRFGASGSGLIDIADARLAGSAPFTAGSYATLPLAGSISLSSSETITMFCATTSANAFAQYPKLNAVKVETLHSP